MEFKLNKIDTDIIQKIENDFKTDRVQPNKESDKSKNIKNNKKDSEENKKNKLKRDKKRHITVDGVKYSENKIEIQAEKGNIDNTEYKGSILDQRK